MLSPEMRLGQRYRLLERIAVGGMGEVWRAEDTVLERKVAVKALLPALLSEPGFAKRFAAEAKTVAALSHPHIVNVHDYGEAPLPSGDTTAYLVMEHIEGQSLSDLITERGAMDPAELMPIVAAVAEALQHAHDHGVIHRDIKPGNILVRASNGQAVLTDFGIARSGAAGDLTATGAVMGTASYIAPEQAEGTGVLPASDMYSLGVVAFHGLTGQRPFDAENPIELALHHVRTPAPPLPPGIAPGVRAFVERAMTKHPSQRFATCAEMAAAARASLTANPPTSPMPSGPPSRNPGAGVVGMGGPLAAVAEPSAPSPPGEVHLGAPGRLPPAAKPGPNKALLGALVGIVALVLIGGMVWLLLLNGFGDEGDDAPTLDPAEQSAENADPESTEEPEQDESPSQTEPSPTPDKSGGLHECLPGANCEDR
ncbi:serine/threonine-protein kinase [Glycomyces tarimensis]